MLVELSPRALRDLRGFEKKTAGEILDGLEILKNRPWPGPPKIKKITGHQRLFRLRVGELRAFFETVENRVIVLRVLDRKELERNLKNL